MIKGFDQRGFTLIELIVVFTVIAILSVIGVAAFVSYGRVQTLETSASELKSTLFLAKSRAISQVNDICISKAQILDGYQVDLSTSTNSYQLKVRCSGFFYPVYPITYLPKNITFDAIKTTSTSFFFPVISSGVKGAGAICLTGYGNSKTITVDPIGGIQ